MIPVTFELAWLEINSLQIDGWLVIAIIWCVAISGGLSISLANWFDHWCVTRSRANEAEEREKTIMNSLKGKDHE